MPGSQFSILNSQFRLCYRVNTLNNSTPTLARRLGAFDATMLVMGGIIGSGIFISPYVVASPHHITCEPKCSSPNIVAFSQFSILNSQFSILNSQFSIRRASDGSHPTTAFPVPITVPYP